MLENFKYAVSVLVESLGSGTLLPNLRQQVFFDRILIPAFLDLTSLDSPPDPLAGLGLRLAELTAEAIQSGTWHFLVSSRRLRALRNLKRGMRGFALVEGNTVLGDIWCVAPRDPRTPVRHPDLKMLGITCQAQEMYSTDMFLAPAYRGRRLAAPFHRAFELRLKQEGWERDYVGYYADNIPAVRMHRALGCIELPRRRVTRFFRFVQSKADREADKSG